MGGIGVVAAGLIAAVAWGAGTAGAANQHTVRTVGGFRFVPNALIMSDFRYSPGLSVVRSGDTVTFTDQSQAPHTTTLVRREDLPTTADEALACEACGPALAAHGGPGPGFRPVVNAGREGFDQPGDSVFFGPGQSATVTITAAPGTTLYYLCALHGWMQGEIRVLPF